VIYKAEKDACRAFPEPQTNEFARGPTRNFQILSPLAFPAEFTQHIPPAGSHLIRYYGWHSNKARETRRKRQQSDRRRGHRARRGSGDSAEPRSRASQAWAMLIKRVYEIAPLACPKCGAEMKVEALIGPQGEMIEKILRHCGRWNPFPITSSWRR
jgi:hypothetical protein